MRRDLRLRFDPKSAERNGEVPAQMLEGQDGGLNERGPLSLRALLHVLHMRLRLTERLLEGVER
jgi:hypothetical protein